MVFNYFEKLPTFKNDVDWCLSETDPKLIIPDPANNFGSGLIGIHNTDTNTHYNPYIRYRYRTIPYQPTLIEQTSKLNLSSITRANRMLRLCQKIHTYVHTHGHYHTINSNGTLRRTIDTIGIGSKTTKELPDSSFLERGKLFKALELIHHVCFQKN